MEERQLKEVMKKVQIKSEMEEEILKNVIKEESRKMQTGMTNKKRKGWQRKAVAAAITLTVVGVGGITVNALVDSVVKERMENMSKEEVKTMVEEVDSQQAEASTYSRELTKEEKERKRELAIAYQEGQFPQGELKKVQDESQVDKNALCFVPKTACFYLPERELTDEELLQMIDYTQKVSYSLQKRYEEEYADEVQAKKEAEEEIKQKNQALGGISEGDAIAKAEEWMNKLYGKTSEGMELSHHIQTAQEAYATSLDGSPVYSVIYTMGENSYYFSISGNGDLLLADHSSSSLIDAEEVSLSEAEDKVQTLYQSAEAYLKDTFGISEDYEEIYCSYSKNAAGEGVDLNVMNFWFVKADRMAYKITFSCDNMKLLGYDFKNYDETLKISRELVEQGMSNERIEVKLK